MLNYDENALNEMLNMVSDNIGNMMNMEDGYLDKMGSISKSGLYGNGVEMIDSQIVSIKDGLNDFKSITNTNARAIEELEKRLKQEVSNIELPKDFDASDVGVKTNTDCVDLSKNDGLSVNPSVLGGTISMEDKYDTELENMYNLTKGDTDKSELKDYEKTITNELENIDNGVVNESELVDLKEGQEKVLEEVESKDTEEQVLEDYEKTNKVMLDEVEENDFTNALEFVDNYDIEKQELEEEPRGDLDVDGN